MTHELFAEDPYLLEFTARVVRNSGREIVLDRTAFYPGGFGQPADQGRVDIGPVNAKVIEVRRAEPDYGDDLDDDEHSDDDLEDSGERGASGGVGGIIHVLDQSLPKTVREVHAALDWPRRYRNMRYNTALALLSVFAGRDLGATPNTGRIRSVRARLDATNPSATVDDAAIRKVESAVNDAIVAGLDVSPENGFTAGDLRLPESGGLHVKNTLEVGGISVSRWMDRGSRGLRLEFTLLDDG